MHRHVASQRGLNSNGRGAISGVSGAPRRPDMTCHALPDWMRSLFDFGNWAPKSTRIWRLQQYEYPESKPDEVDVLEVKVNRLAAADGAKRTEGGVDTQGPALPAPNQDGNDLPALGSFTTAGDSDLAKALSQRIQSISSQDSDTEFSSSGDEQEDAVSAIPATTATQDEVPPLTGEEMRKLILAKYGKQYDCSFVRRDIPGKTFVCLNIMWQHLEQRSFRMTPEQYEEKTDSIAFMVNVLGQTKKVRSVLSARARSEKGLPKRPVVGTAISIQLELEPQLIKEFFSAGYQ